MHAFLQVHTPIMESREYFTNSTGCVMKNTTHLTETQSSSPIYLVFAEIPWKRIKKKKNPYDCTKGSPFCAALE